MKELNEWLLELVLVPWIFFVNLELVTVRLDERGYLLRRFKPLSFHSLFQFPNYGTIYSFQK